MDDEIIYSWCFNDVKCFDSTPSAAIIILDKDLESFSSLGSHQERERRSRHKEEHCLMLNIVVEKGASKDLDWSRSSITWPRTSTPMGFVQRSRLDFGLGTGP